MLLRLRRRAFLAPAAVMWLASIPATLALASREEGSRPSAQIVEAGAVISVPVVSPRVDRPERARRATVRETSFIARDGERITAARLRAFLRERESPMAPHAETIVAAGIRYRVDPRSIVAIAGVESAFGTAMACFNAWGWDRGVCRWSSWRQAITSYARLISSAYPSLRRGDFRTAGRTYNPANWEQWAQRCSGYFRAI